MQNPKVITDIQAFFTETPFGRHAHSYLKTYFTLFITLYAFQMWGQDRPGGEVELFNWPMIAVSAKWSIISILRSAYKIGVEKQPIIETEKEK